MSAIRSKDTTPEIVVRRLVHALGCRFRLHVRDLPGTPDLVLPRHRKVIEVRGCFWHQHKCPRTHLPGTNRRYWLPKLRRNVLRDRQTQRKLHSLGWRVLVVWECQVREPERLLLKLSRFLSLTRARKAGGVTGRKANGKQNGGSCRPEARRASSLAPAFRRHRR